MSEQLFSCDGPPNECGQCEVCQQVALVHLMHDEDEQEYFIPYSAKARPAELLQETAAALGFEGENGDR